MLSDCIWELERRHRKWFTLKSILFIATQTSPCCSWTTSVSKDRVESNWVIVSFGNHSCQQDWAFWSPAPTKDTVINKNLPFGLIWPQTTSTSPNDGLDMASFSRHRRVSGLNLWSLWNEWCSVVWGSKDHNHPLKNFNKVSYVERFLQFLS